MSAASHKKVFYEINITPLTDIFLVLLIIMMVVAPILTNARRDIKTPNITSGNQINQEWPVLEISPDSQFFVKGQIIRESDLTETLKAQRPADASKENVLLLRADKIVKSHKVLKVLEAAKEAGFERVVLAGESKSPAVAASAQAGAEPKAAETPDATPAAESKS